MNFWKKLLFGSVTEMGVEASVGTRPRMWDYRAGSRPRDTGIRGA